MGGSFKPMVVGYFYFGGFGLHLARCFQSQAPNPKLAAPKAPPQL